MLVLTRTVNDWLVITTPDGVEIRVTLCDKRGKQARIGIDAPKAYKVLRSEVWAAIQRERRTERDS